MLDISQAPQSDSLLLVGVYDTSLVILSILVAVALSVSAFWLRFRIIRREGKHEILVVLFGGIILGIAIAAMLYLGIIAARVVGTADVGETAGTINSHFLALAISFVVISFTALVVGANGLLRYREVNLRLCDSEEKFRSLIDNIPGISYRCLPDNNWSMIYISDAVQRFTGYPVADFMPGGGRTFSDIIHPDDVARVEHEVFAGGNTFNIEYRIVGSDGLIRHVWENGNLIRNQQGDIEWLDGVILDITERHEMEQALRDEKNKAEEAAAAKTSFLANVSHEIRTPMNAIIGFTEVLLASDLTAEQKQHLKTINIATDSLLHLLNDILDAAKLEKGLIELDSSNFSLEQTLQQVITTLDVNASRKGVALHLDYDSAVGEFFRGDEQRLRQVILNIVGNAIKFTHQGEVVVSVTNDHNLICICVRDTGIGIPADRLDTIFAPFIQADASMTRRFGGTGLGTTISKHLVELMGGEIQVVSEPGVGTIFTLRLPLAKGEVASRNLEKTAIALPPLRMLVVDDVLPNVQLLNVLLRKGQHYVVIATNGEEALIKFKQETFDVVLMDIQMPVMDGLEASRQIRAYEQSHAKPATPIIALTASVLEKDRHAAVAAGMEGFATKPIILRELYTVIARLLNIRMEEVAVDPCEFIESPSLSMISLPLALDAWQSETDYFKALKYFASENCSLPKKLQALHIAQDSRGIEQLLHQVKGAAANLALLPLTQAVDRLMLARGPGEQERWRAKIDELSLVLARTLLEIDSLTSASNSVEPYQATPNEDIFANENDIENALTILRSALSVNQIDDSALGFLRELSAARGQQSAFDKLELVIADFEFTRALKQLDLLQQKLLTPRE